uniref:(northern house mosquito) hypothetical protein n=1 Tax=Culex pipiens TaxID=7175 RepID=A0A8D8C3T2_CULPI
MINDANRTAQQRSSGALQKDRRGRHGEGNVFSSVPEILEKVQTQKCALPCGFAGFVGSLLWSWRSDIQRIGTTSRSGQNQRTAGIAGKTTRTLHLFDREQH